MKKTLAIAIKDEIQQICNKYGLWYEAKDAHRPVLKKIKIEIEILVDQE